MSLFCCKKINKFYVCSTEHDLSNKVAQIICETVKKNHHAVLGFDGSNDVIKICEKIGDLTDKHNISFKNAFIFNTDEYIDVAHEYQKFSKTNLMHDHLFAKIDIDFKNTFFPNQENMKDYDKKIKKVGPIDLLVLTIGQNGRLAFNEPKINRRSKTHEQVLSNSTRRFLMQYFNEKIYVPTKAITMGIDSIMQAKKIILIATGETKSAALGVLTNRKYNKLWPATILNYHNDVSIFTDVEACKLLMQ